MKKILTLLATLLLCLQYSPAQAQQNIYMWKQGTLSVTTTSEVDSLTFDVGQWLYSISCSTPVGITTTSAKAIVSVSLGANVKSVSVTPEIGVCYSYENAEPTTTDTKVKLGSSMTDYTVNIGNLYSGTKYYYRAYVKLLDHTFYSSIQSFTTLGNDNKPKVDGYLNGHSYVDLGLPSGLKWATCNVGASSPSDDGDYFAWGETQAKSSYSWSTYKWSDNGSSSSFTKYTKSSGLTTLESSDDAATQNWGDGWRMPTLDEYNELLNNTTNEWTTLNGVKGRKFTSKTNGAFVFFPAAGYRNDDYLSYHGSYGFYWSSSLFSSYDDYAYNLYFNSGSCDWNFDSRRYGRSVRAVCQ